MAYQDYIWVVACAIWLLSAMYWLLYSVCYWPKTRLSAPLVDDELWRKILEESGQENCGDHATTEDDKEASHREVSLRLRALAS